MEYWNLNFATFDKRFLSSEASLEVLFKELEGIKWDVIGLSEVRRTGEAFAELKNGHFLCYHGVVDKRELGVGFLVHKRIAGNIDEYYRNNERAAGLVIRLNKRYKLKVVQGYGPTSSHDDQIVEGFYEYVESAMAKVKKLPPPPRRES